MIVRNVELKEVGAMSVGTTERTTITVDEGMYILKKNQICQVILNFSLVILFFSDRRGVGRDDERVERLPEWADGPASVNEVIELKGFDEPKSEYYAFLSSGFSRLLVTRQMCCKVSGL